MDFEWVVKYATEFLGTAILIVLGNGAVANVELKGTKGHQSGWFACCFTCLIAQHAVARIGEQIPNAQRHKRHLQAACSGRGCQQRRKRRALVGLFDFDREGKPRCR